MRGTCAPLVRHPGRSCHGRAVAHADERRTRIQGHQDRGAARGEPAEVGDRGAEFTYLGKDPSSSDRLDAFRAPYNGEFATPQILTSNTRTST
jgi:hypothetical protein